MRAVGQSPPVVRVGVARGLRQSHNGRRPGGVPARSWPGRGSAGVSHAQSVAPCDNSRRHGAEVRVSAYLIVIPAPYREMMTRDTAQGEPVWQVAYRTGRMCRIPYLRHRRVEELRRSRASRRTVAARGITPHVLSGPTRPVLAPRISAAPCHRDSRQVVFARSQTPRNIPVSALDERSETSYTHYPVVTVPRFSPTHAGVKSCHL